MSKVIGNHVGGSHINQNGGILQDVFNPSTGEVSAQVRFTSASELDNVVKLQKQPLLLGLRQPLPREVK